MYHILKYLEIWPQDTRNIEQVRWVLKRARACTEEPYYLAHEFHDFTISKIFVTQKVCVCVYVYACMEDYESMEGCGSLN